MAVPIETIQVGCVFKFKNGPRRVAHLSVPIGRGFQVTWEYADSVKRNGKLGGSQWVHYFRRDAICELNGKNNNDLLAEFKSSGQTSYVEWLEAQLIASRAANFAGN